ncbi:ABC transporter G family member 23 [Anabrus simplex]|uniref:ABC transporter G family member 23 n=1 Tax=Anabrus simplex TaxID=316456 RepID=UPI0035A2D3E2
MTDYAVYIRNGCKSYGRGSKAVPILQNLDMTVPKGSIYGLLGASGCGKTTLLSCVVGCQNLNSGDIWVLGGRPGAKGSGVPGPRVGYMPQDIALAQEFTVREAVFFFGWLFQMNRKDIEERFDFLSALLDLPSSGRYIKSLSGGQQRRVSFAAALVNSPELLILDEPTVGLDPLLRRSIWDYLVELTAARKVTVIITTHYIEEAREAHMIGLLRGGRLLAEDAPQRLLALYKCSALEDVFLTLSMQQGESSRTHVELPVIESPDIEPMHLRRQNELVGGDIGGGNKGKPHKVAPTSRITFSRMKALLIKNFTAIYRNRGGLLFITMFPVIQICVFFMAIGHDPRDLTLAIANEELGNLTDCAEYKRYHNVGVISSNDEYYFSGISCVLLELLNENFANKVYYSDKESATIAVQDGRSVGVVHFLSNFSEQFHQRFELGKNAPPSVFEGSEINIHLDMADRQIGLYMQSKLLSLYFDMTENIAAAWNSSEKVFQIPMQFHDPVYGVKEPSYVNMVAPGVIISMIYFLATTLTSTVIITEQFEGVWDRNLVAGVTSAEILISHILCQLVCMFVQCVEVIALALFVFNVVCHGHIAALLALVFLQGVCGMCFGLVISVISENLTMANYMSLGSFFPFLTVSGVLWPIEGMPTALKWFSMMLPGTLPTLSMRYIMEKGWSLIEPQVLYGYLMTIAWIIGQSVFCLIVLRIRNT